jgi:hypothetical protein
MKLCQIMKFYQEKIVKSEIFWRWFFYAGESKGELWLSIAEGGDFSYTLFAKGAIVDNKRMSLLYRKLKPLWFLSLYSYNVLGLLCCTAPAPLIHSPLCPTKLLDYLHNHSIFVILLLTYFDLTEPRFHLCLIPQNIRYFQQQSSRFWRYYSPYCMKDQFTDAEILAITCYLPLIVCLFGVLRFRDRNFQFSLISITKLFYSRMLRNMCGSRGKRWQENGGDYIERSFVICTTSQICFDWLNQEEWHVQGL